MAENRQNNRSNYNSNRNQNHTQNQNQGRNQGRNQNYNQNQTQNQSSGQIQLAVKGWAVAPSKFANNPESGVSAIVIFLEKKSQRKIHSHKALANSWVLLIDIDAGDAQRFYHLNGFTFSGAPITIEESRGRAGQNQNQNQQNNNNNRTPLGPGQQNQQSNIPSGPRNQRNDNSLPSGPRNQRDGNQSQRGSADLIPGFNQNNPFFNNSQNTFGQNNTQNAFGQRQKQPEPPKPREPSQRDQLEDLMVSIVRKRYNAANHFLTFEALSKDADVQASAIIESPAPKVWSAFFTICENKVFETPAKRREMVQSVSLAHNDLKDVKDVIALSATFPQLKNLDLSNNNISNAGDLRFWRNAFRSLEHIVFLNNPIMNQPEELKKITRWYRNLKMINNEPVVPDGMSLDAAFNNRTASPAPTMPGITTHPEVDLTTFAQPLPGKPEEQLMKERMGLQFSVETHLKMQYVEMCLAANGFNYDLAMKNLRELFEQGQVPADAFLG